MSPRTPPRRCLDLRIRTQGPLMARFDAHWRQAAGQVHAGARGDVLLQARWAEAATGPVDREGQVVLALLEETGTGRALALAWDADVDGLFATAEADRLRLEVEAVLSGPVAAALHPSPTDHRPPAASVGLRQPDPEGRWSDLMEVAWAHADPAAADPAADSDVVEAPASRGAVGAGGESAAPSARAGRALALQALACAALGVPERAARDLRTQTVQTLAGQGLQVMERMPVAVWACWAAAGADPALVSAWYAWWARCPDPHMPGQPWSAQRVQDLVAFARAGWSPQQVAVLQALVGTVEPDRLVGWWVLASPLSRRWCDLPIAAALAAAHVGMGAHEAVCAHQRGDLDVRALQALAALEGRQPIPSAEDLARASPRIPAAGSAWLQVVHDEPPQPATGRARAQRLFAR